MKILQNCFLILTCSSLLIATCSTKVQACDTEATAKETSTCVVMPRSGQSGVWFSLEKANELRIGNIEIPELKIQIEKYQEIEKNLSEEVASLRSAVDLQKDSIANLELAVGIYVKQAREASEDAQRAKKEIHAWYRSPWLWTTVGILLGSGSAILIVSMTSK